MYKSSFKANLWFQERTPDFYFWIITLISIVVFSSAIKMFTIMQSKSKTTTFSYKGWQKWTIFGLAMLLLAMFIGDLIYRYIAYYQVMPYHTSYSWKYNLFTSFFMFVMLGLWIFKGIINKQWIEWRTDLFSWKLTRLTLKKMKKEKWMTKWGRKVVETSTPSKTKVASKSVIENVLAPVAGTIHDITKVNDKVFSKKLMGDGIAISPTQKTIVSPVDGVVESAFPTGHAFGIKTKNNLSLLIHIGIDTVKLNGKGFKTKIKQGDKIKAGQILSVVDFETIKRAKYNTDVIMIVLLESNKTIIEKVKMGKVSSKQLIFKVK